MREKVAVYLAGPLTGCKPKQATAWRRNLANLLGKDFKILDPSKEGSRRGAMAVSADVEQADVVIANMWKESIGTALQIAQAQRLGIPVILIDQHYMDHAVLESLVDKTVRGEQEAAKFLQNELSKTLRPELMVIKKTKREPFDFLKLQRSLKACCTVAGVDDVVFCKMLSRQVRRSILTLAAGGSIHSDKLKAVIFDNLSKLSIDNDKLNPIDQAEVREKAALVRDQWEEYELLYKSDRKKQMDFENSYIEELDRLTSDIDSLSIELWQKQTGLEVLAAANNNDDRKIDYSKAVAAKLQKRLNGRRGLCVGFKGRATFRSAFERFGLDSQDFERFFEEKYLDGKQSNLNIDIAGWATKYGIVLYAWSSLRHISDEKLKSDNNLVRGCTPADAIRRMLSMA